MNHASTKQSKFWVSARIFRILKFFQTIKNNLTILDRGFREKNISFRPAQFRGKELVSFTMHNWQKQTLNDIKVRNKGLQVTG